MKKTSRIATACVAGALATGMLTVPASAQSAYMEPTASSQAVGDAVVGSATLPFRTLFPLANQRNPIGISCGYRYLLFSYAIHDHRIVVQQAMPPQ